MWVLYSFKVALDYSSLYIYQCIFDAMVLLWKKNIFNSKFEFNLEEAFTILLSYLSEVYWNIRFSRPVFVCKNTYTLSNKNYTEVSKLISLFSRKKIHTTACFIHCKKKKLKKIEN